MKRQFAHVIPAAIVFCLLASRALAEAASVSPLDFEMQMLDGSSFNFGERYRGKVVLIVNVPFRCGYLSNGLRFQRLQRLHEQYSARGLAIVAAPSEQFVKRWKLPQEDAPTAQEFLECCEKNYGIEFDVSEKVEVLGKSQSKLYAYLTKASSENQRNQRHAQRISWDFEKFLLDRDGRVVARYLSGVMADSYQVVSDVEAALNEVDE